MEPKPHHKIIVVVLLWVVACGCKSTTTQKTQTDSKTTESATSSEAVDRVIRIDITPEQIRAGDEKVATVESGRVTTPSKDDGADTPIPALAEVVRERVSAIEEAGQSPKALIVFQSYVPYRLVTATSLTAATAGATNQELAVGRSDDGNGLDIDDDTRFPLHTPKSTGPIHRAPNVEAVVGWGTIDIRTRSTQVPPAKGCENTGVTVCSPKGKMDVEEVVAGVRKAYANGKTSNAAMIAKHVISAYDYALFYTVLAEVKSRRPGDRRIAVGAKPGVPAGIVVDVMNYAKIRLPEDEYLQLHTLGAARRAAGDDTEPLYDKQMLLMVE